MLAKTNPAIKRAKKAVKDYFGNISKHFDTENMRHYDDNEYVVSVKPFEAISGMERLGSGHYSIVYAIDDAHVLKIVKNHDSGYARYVAAAKKHKNNPHFPKILFAGEIAGKTIYVLERLNDSPTKGDGREMFDMFNLALQAVRNSNPWITCTDKNVQQIADVLNGDKHGRSMMNDLHYSNLMWRGDVPVVTDPCSE